MPRLSIYRRPTMERLEDRTLLAADPVFDAVSGALTLTGDDRDNVARIRLVDDTLTVAIDGRVHSFAAAGNLAHVAFSGRSGQDILILDDIHLAGSSLTVQGDEAVQVAGHLWASVAAISATDSVQITSPAEIAAAFIGLTARVVTIGGSLRADGGRIEVAATNVLHFGVLSASSAQAGGVIDIHIASNYRETTAARTLANGTDRGGIIRIQGDAGSTIYASGQHVATGQTGGRIDMLASQIDLMAAMIDVSGGRGGGSIRIGGDLQGANHSLRNADATNIGRDTILRADALARGDGGRVIVWSDQQTQYRGTISARGGAAAGAGGFVEVSGKSDLTFAGLVDVGASQGAPGTLLLDPKNLIIDGVDESPYFDLVDPSPNNGGDFGSMVVPLSTGNVVVSDPYDDFGGTNGGAVYLFNGLTGALISVLYGGSNSNIGQTGTVALSNGNFVVNSSFWDNGAITDVGAVTWGSGITGISGEVSVANSLIGSTSGDILGCTGIVAMSNGNYVVRTATWNNGTGSATWADGTTGIVGVVSAANSLVGSQSGDAVGRHVFKTSNGNYLVSSTSWNDEAGAVTWGNSAVGVTGVVSAANSLVGSTAGDRIGSDGFLMLDNGNYVVCSREWDNGAVKNAGAATWGNGTTGVSGEISAANSLVGSASNDNVGGHSIKLSNGNYVIISSSWGEFDVGAITWCDGSTGTSDLVSAANSLVGSTNGDRVGANGRVTALSNGHYVVSSPWWDNGTAIDAGAVTWCDGAMPTAGAVSVSNSLVGTSNNDTVGLDITPLSNGNYVVRSRFWNNGTVVAAGAVTWADGTTGIIGAVSAANSLVGTSTDDQVGSDIGGGVTALSNGNYVVRSHLWDNGAAVDAGAATWADGTIGIIGEISAANSLVGTSSNDRVGFASWDGYSGGIVALSNGNYLVRSDSWNNGAATAAGAVTWADGTIGITGAITSANSLVGATSNDRVGSHGVTELSNGNFLVRSTLWNNGGASAAGAVTWGSGTTGVSGVLSASNSLVGTSTDDQVGSQDITKLSNGNYVVRSQFWNNGTATSAGAVTWGNGATGVSGVVSAANSLVGSTSGDEVGAGLDALSNGNYLVRSSDWDNGVVIDAGAVTWGNGATGVRGAVSASNSIVGTETTTWVTTAEDTVNGTFLASFHTASGRVAVASSLPPPFTYGALPDATKVFHPHTLEAILNSGVHVILQASNDITVNSPITVNNPIGTGGDLTLQAGRSIIINASIDTDGGNLTVIANDVLASGVVDAERDPGPAIISMAEGMTLNAGVVRIELRSGAGKTHMDSAAITLQTVSGDMVTIENHGLSGGNVLLQGAIMASSDLSLAATGFIHQSGGHVMALTAAFLAADGAITMTSAGNNFVGAVTLDVAGPIGLTSTATLQLTNLTAHDDISLAAASIQLAELTVGNHVVTFSTGSDLHLGVLTTIGAGGTLVSASNVVVGAGDTLLGVGAVNVGSASLIVQAGGTLAPGASPGTLFLNGNLALQAGSNLAIELDGTDAGLFDVLDVTGTIDLGGANLAITIGFSPILGDAFPILVNNMADALTATFTTGGSVTAGAVAFSIDYATGSSNDIVLTVTDLSASGPPAEPTASEDSYILLEDSASPEINVLANDHGVGLAIIGITQGNHGNVINVGTHLRYDPAPGFIGSDSFTYTIRDSDGDEAAATVNLDIIAANDRPTITMPATLAYGINADTLATGVIVSDIDADTSAIQVTLTVGHGTLTLGDLTGSTGNGSPQIVISGPLSAVNAALASLTYTPDRNYGGTDSLMVEIDDLGNTGAGGNLTATASMELTPVGNDIRLQKSLSFTGKKDLLITGTAGNDTIKVTFSGTSTSKMTVRVNGEVRGKRFAPSGQLLIFGLGGDDTISVSSKIKKRAWINGGDGSDVVTGGGGSDILLGGSGDDIINAGGGRDLIIGGDQSDALTGGAADDILIGSGTAYDDNGLALDAVMKEWTSKRSFATRVARLGGPGVDGYALRQAPTTTVADDGFADTLTGGKKADWFWAFGADVNADLAHHIN